MDLRDRVTELRKNWVLGKKRMYESVNIIGGATRADLFQQNVMIACRAGRLIIFPTFLHVLLSLFGLP